MKDLDKKAYLDMIGAGVGDRVHKVLGMIHREVLVGLRESRDVLISSPHIAERKEVRNCWL